VNRFRIGAQIGITLGINLALLLLLLAAFLSNQNRSGIESLWFAPARENIRALGSLVEAQFPGKTPAERSVILETLQKRYRVTLVVYEDTGRLIGGPDLHPPTSVLQEIRRSPVGWSAPAPPEEPTFIPPPKPAVRAMFLVKEDDPSRYWIGVNTPIAWSTGAPPVRHALVVVTPTLLSSPLFIDWTPWIFGSAIALLVSILCWYPLVRRVTRSIDAMRVAASHIAEGRFKVDVPAGQGRDELSELGGSIARMATQLSQLANGQTRFLADIAHELCAPILRIQLSAGILEQRAPATDLQHVQRLERDVEHMSALVADLLSFTKGAVRTPDLKPVALAELVKAVADRENTQQANLTADLDESIAVMADRESLERAVGNVVRNAIRYAGYAGPIHIGAERYAGSDATSHIRLTVEDCGPGLPEKELEAVFAPFYRPDASRAPGTGGAGLGLAIVRKCIEVCGGKVSCSNRQPRGLSVDIHLREAESV